MVQNFPNGFPSVGVIGAGQLARMMMVSANDLGINLVALAQNENDSAALIGPYLLGDYKELEDIKNFAKKFDLLTFEHELTPIPTLKSLEKSGVHFYPHPDSFKYSQDKIEMRNLMQKLSLPNPKYEIFDFQLPSNLPYPLIAKLPTGGYDGRGVWKIDQESELLALKSKTNAKLLLEELIDFEYEASVMVARSPHNQVATWPPTKTIQKEGICVMTITPIPNISSELSQDLQLAAIEIAKAIDLVGVMAVELFVKGNTFYINELALRPHNSGHWSIEGSVTSQFEQHLRAILDLPLGDTSLTAPHTVMGNILGAEKTDLYRPYLHLMARNPKMKFHQYGKEVKPGRKVGHVTLTGDNLMQMILEVEHAVDYMNGKIDE